MGWWNGAPRHWRCTWTKAKAHRKHLITSAIINDDERCEERRGRKKREEKKKFDRKHKNKQYCPIIYQIKL